MAITITTLANEAAVNKTFTEISKDRVSAEWLNTTDLTDSFNSRIFIRQSVSGPKSKGGSSTRRVVVSAKATQAAVAATELAPATPEETILVNVTLTTPTGLRALTSTHRKDLMAFLRNLVTGTVLEQLARGEV